jgi:putative ABC transport system substrate-binding protein
MSRRRFLTALAIAAMPVAVAQPRGAARVVIRMPGTEKDSREFGYVMPERLGKALAAFGYLEGRNLVFVMQYLGDNEKVVSATQLAEIRSARTDAIVSVGVWGTVPLRDAVRDVPIVAWAIEDPVSAGLARTFTRPGGNVTGLTQGKEGVFAKQVDFLRTIVPGLTGIAVFGNRGAHHSRDVLAQFEALEAAIVAAGVKHVSVPTVGPKALEAMATLRRDGVEAGIYFFNPAPLGRATQRLHAEEAIRQRVAILGYFANLADDGFLASYGELDDDLFRRLALQLDRVLRGGNPSEIPFMGPQRFHLRVNRRTAQALGLAITPRVSLLADEVVP